MIIIFLRFFRLIELGGIKNERCFCCICFIGFVIVVFRRQYYEELDGSTIEMDEDIDGEAIEEGFVSEEEVFFFLGSFSDDFVILQLDRVDRLELVVRGIGGGDEGQRRVRGRRKCLRLGAGFYGGYYSICLYVCLISVLLLQLCVVIYNVIGYRYV